MASSKKNLKGMTDAERLVLMEKMDRELDEFVDNAVARSKAMREKEGPKKKQTIDELADELLRHPLFMKEIDPSKPMSNEVLALQALKFEDEDPTAKAECYKDEGNYYFQKNDNRLAVTNYTEGIAAKCPDQKLNAILYSNRAAAQYHLGNFKSSLRDCILSRKCNPMHFKPVMRGIQCCMEMKRYKDAVIWCNAGLTLESENKNIQDLRSKADKLQRAEEKDRRKEAGKERKKMEEEQKLITAIKIRDISLAGIRMNEKLSDFTALSLASLEGHNMSGARVHVNDDGSLQWPVLFIYPEHSQTDFIEAFHENSRFIDHFNNMFSSEAEPPSWDEERKYQVDKLMIYFEEKQKEKLHVVNTSCTLLDVLTSKSYIVQAGTPSFIILVDGSKFQQAYLKKYEIVL